LITQCISLESITQPVEPNELDKYLGPTLLPNPRCEIEQNLLALNNLPVYANDKNKKVKQNKKTNFTFIIRWCRLTTTIIKTIA